MMSSGKSIHDDSDFFNNVKKLSSYIDGEILQINNISGPHGTMARPDKVSIGHDIFRYEFCARITKLNVHKFYWFFDAESLIKFNKLITNTYTDAEIHQVNPDRDASFFIDLDWEIDFIDDYFENIDEANKQVAELLIDAIQEEAEGCCDNIDNLAFTVSQRSRETKDNTKISLHVYTNIAIVVRAMKPFAQQVRERLINENKYEWVESMVAGFDDAPYKHNASLAMPFGSKHNIRSTLLINNIDPLITAVAEGPNHLSYDTYIENTTSDYVSCGTLSDFGREAFKHTSSIPNSDAFNFKQYTSFGTGGYRIKRIKASNCQMCDRKHETDNTLLIYINESKRFATWRCDKSGQKGKLFYKQEKETNNEETIDKEQERKNDKLMNYICNFISIEKEKLLAMISDTEYDFSFEWRQKHVITHNRPDTKNYYRWGEMIDYIHSYQFESEQQAIKLLAIVIDKFFIVMTNGQYYRRPNLIDAKSNKTMEAERTDPLTSMLFHYKDNDTIQIKSASKLIKDHMPYFHKYESFIVSFEKLNQENDPNEYISCVPFSGQIVDDFDKSSISGILEFIFEVVCGEQENLYNHFIEWLAKVVQYPDTKTQIVPIFYTPKEGCGKTAMCDLIIALIGLLSTDQSSGSIESLVNERREHLIGKKLAVVNEIREGRSAFMKHHEAFKSLITDNTFDVRPLYGAKITVKNCLEVIITTNFINSIPTGKSARRFQMFRFSTKYLQNKEYFSMFYNNYVNNPIAINNLYTYLMKHVKVSRGPMNIVETDDQNDFKESTQGNVETFWKYFTDPQEEQNVALLECHQYKISKTIVYEKYKIWCKENGENAYSCNNFKSHSIGIENVQEGRNNKGRFWQVNHEN